MNRSLDELIDSARAQPVPWSSERAARVERGLLSERSRRSASWAKLTLGGLASAALCASFVLVARTVRQAALTADESALGTPLGERSEPELGALDSPVGDGGFAEDSAEGTSGQLTP